MYKCASCNKQFNDGVQCQGCKRHLDFSCASITEVGYRKLGAERRASWRCPICRGASPSPRSDHEPISLEMIMSELRDMKRQLSSLPTLVEEMRGIKDDITELKKSCEFTSSKVDEFQNRLLEMERKFPDIVQLQERLSQADDELIRLRGELQARDQLGRLNNVEIKGVPLKRNENLYTIIDTLGKTVGYEVAKSQINYIARVPIPNTKDKSIVVSFLNRYTKEDFVASARAKKIILARDLGYHDSQVRIFVNDHLSPHMKSLLTKTKALARTMEYQYVWVKFSKVHLRKNDSSHVIIIRTEKDLNKII